MFEHLFCAPILNQRFPLKQPKLLRICSPFFVLDDWYIIGKPKIRFMDFWLIQVLFNIKPKNLNTKNLQAKTNKIVYKMCITCKQNVY
jgi:hypothetical protein